jgi:hypothetical protein
MAIVPVVLDIATHGAMPIESTTGKRYLHCLVDSSSIASLKAKGLLVSQTTKDLPADLKTDAGTALHEFYGVPMRDPIKKQVLSPDADVTP